MYRVDEGERRVVQLDALAASDSEVITPDSLPTSCVSAPQKSNTRKSTSKSTQEKKKKDDKKSSSIPPTESDPADVVLHADGCAVALHLSVLQLRCPWLYKQLRQLRHAPETQTGTIALKLLSAEEIQQFKSKQQEDTIDTKCPLYNPQSLRLDYVRCAAHKCRRGHSSQEDSGGQSLSQQDSPAIVQRRKRLRQDPEAAAVTDENQPLNGQVVAQPISGQLIVQKSRRARSLFTEVDVLSPTKNVPNEDGIVEKQRLVMHVKIEGTNVGAVVAAVEYIYRFKVRMIDEQNALHAVRLGQWLGMRNTMLYYCLVIAIRHVTLKTWMEMLLAASALTDKVMRRILCDLLMNFVKRLQPEQYCDVLTDMRCVYISRLKHHDILVHAVVGLINNVRLVEFWRNLLDALSKWVCYRFQKSQTPSLRAMHHHFAPEWKPYVEIKPVEIGAKSGKGELYTLHQFGKFQFQIRIDIDHEMPIMWRIIRSSSPQLLSTDSDMLDDRAALDTDPQFWIRGQMKVKYWRAQPNPSKVSVEVVIEYQHCYKQYSQWRNLVPPSPSTLAPVATTAAIQPEYMGNTQFRGKFFIWGDPVCSMYHFLLHTTLFYSAPHGASTELSDLMVVSEMQRLPLETLVLVLRSDRLRIPEGERTLLRCLNKLVFGNNFSYLGSSSPNQNRVTNEYNGEAKDVIRLYKCVRWCFVPLDDIIGTLRRSPRELKFYELIEKGLQDMYRRFLRRRPWGWRKYRHAYMKNETNVAEFTIEAGDSKLSPEYFQPFPKNQPASQDSLILSPKPVYSGPMCA